MARLLDCGISVNNSAFVERQLLHKKWQPEDRAKAEELFELVSADVKIRFNRQLKRFCLQKKPSPPFEGSSDAGTRSSFSGGAAELLERTSPRAQKILAEALDDRRNRSPVGEPLAVTWSRPPPSTSSSSSSSSRGTKIRQDRSPAILLFFFSRRRPPRPLYVMLFFIVFFFLQLVRGN
jgi:hypothetical protein